MNFLVKENVGFVYKYIPNYLRFGIISIQNV